MFNGRVHLPTRNLLYCSLPNKGARPVATDANGETEIDLEFLRSTKFWLFVLTNHVLFSLHLLSCYLITGFKHSQHWPREELVAD